MIVKSAPFIHIFLLSATVSYTTTRESATTTAFVASFLAYMGREPGLCARMKKSPNVA